MNVDEVIPLADAKAKLTRRLGIVMDGQIHNEDTIAAVKKIFENFEGNIPISLRITNGKGFRDFYLSYKVNPTDEAVAQIVKLLGEDSIKYFTS